MTIYNINFGIGWASSGIEYAQSYRAELLRNTKHEMKFIFLDFIQNENIQTLTSNMNFKDDEIIWLYQYFSDIRIAPTTYTIEDVISTLNNKVTKIEDIGKMKRLFFNDNRNFVTLYLKDENKSYVDRAEFVSDGMLIRKDFYSYTRILSEFYAPKDNRAKLYMRKFYNEDGTTVYSEVIDGDSSMFIFKDVILTSKQQFIAYFMKRLNLSKKDIIIMDRASKIGQAVLQNKGAAKIGVVVHAEHYSIDMTDNLNILWNNYYEYQFSQAKEVDFFITATDSQKRLLSHQFNKYKGLKPSIYTIPVGSLKKLSHPKNKRRRKSIITASRLATEKHIDWLILSVIKAKKVLPDLTFDIYGEGVERSYITSIIDDNDASDYIRLKGHTDLSDIYCNYELFLSGSTSEGFGLTLMEAVGSGLGIIGFDVNYGNPTFIRHEKNGYLIPIQINNYSIDKLTDELAVAIIHYFDQDIKQVQKVSYDIANQFKFNEVKTRWLNLIEEVLA